MSEKPEDDNFQLVRAVTVRVTCMRHGDEAIAGSVGTFNLGYGKVMLDLNGRVDCRLCGNDIDGWLHLSIETEADLVITKQEMVQQLMEDYAASKNQPEEVETEPAVSQSASSETKLTGLSGLTLWKGRES